MGLLILKVVLTPLLIAAATLASRRWGLVVGGLIVALPLTSGPVSVFLALEEGKPFATQAATRVEWPVSTAVGLVAFLVVTGILRELFLPLKAAFPLVCIVLAIAAAAIPNRPQVATSHDLPRWDIPLRMLAATTVVLVLTGAAAGLGPAWTGLLTPVPVFVAVLAAFCHHSEGSTAATRLLRGALLGCYGFVAFFLVVALLLPLLSVVSTYLLAGLAALAVNTLWAVFAAQR